MDTMAGPLCPFCRCSSPAACFTFFRTCIFFGNCQQHLRLGGTVSKQFASLWLELLTYCCVGSTLVSDLLHFLGPFASSCSIFVTSITPWTSVLAVRCRFTGSSGWSSDLLDLATTSCSSALGPFSTPCACCILIPLLSGGNFWWKFSCTKEGHDQMSQ